MTAPQHELVLELILDAPKEKLYRGWTEPELMKQWFAPAPWTTPHAENDLRPGGASLVVMRSPEGQEFPNPGQYLEIVPNRKLVFTDAFVGNWVPKEGAPFFACELTFEDAGPGKTKYTARARHWTAEVESPARTDGFHARLDDLRETARSAGPDALMQSSLTTQHREDTPCASSRSSAAIRTARPPGRATRRWRSIARRWAARSSRRSRPAAMVTTGGIGLRADDWRPHPQQGRQDHGRDAAGGRRRLDGRGRLRHRQCRLARGAGRRPEAQILAMGEGTVEFIHYNQFYPAPEASFAPPTSTSYPAGVIPYLSFDNATEVIDFYTKAFGAKEIARMYGEDGKRIMHCQLEINGGGAHAVRQFRRVRPAADAALAQLCDAARRARWRRVVGPRHQGGLQGNHAVCSCALGRQVRPDARSVRRAPGRSAARRSDRIRGRSDGEVWRHHHVSDHDGRRRRQLRTGRKRLCSRTRRRGAVRACRSAGDIIRAVG